MRSQYGLIIDGKEVQASNGAVFQVENPFNRHMLFEVADGTADDVNSAVEAATRAFEEGRWSKQRPRARARVLVRAAELVAARTEELARDESLQIGRPIREMRAQMARAREWFEYFAAVAQAIEGSVTDFGEDHLNYVIREPLGVAGLISPWNHPLHVALKKLSCALAAGNSIVLKPSELAPATVIELVDICHEAGVPEGVVNIVPGLGSGAGKALAAHPGLARVDFTGGTETGRRVAASAGPNLASYTMELGGKAPVIVFDDVDPRVAAAGASFAAFIASGQTCVQGSRVLVQQRNYDSVLAELARIAGAMCLGNPLDDSTQMGPVISEASQSRVSSAVSTAVRQGAETVAGGHIPGSPELRDGYFFEPTVITGASRDTEVWREELFGPVTVVCPFADEQEAIALGNDTRYGLAASVWTENVGRAHRVARQLQVGTVWINDHHRLDPAAPWGGKKDSGVGRENGLEAYRAYTQPKSVVVNTHPDPFNWYGSDQPLRYS